MSTILLSLPEIFASYKNWVSQNPQHASDYETTAKWISYFIAGRINNSHVVSELVYALSNLVVLFNDRIINQVRQIELPSSGDRLKLWLTVIEYCEVFCELSAKKLWGNRGKWLVIVAIQIFKCLARLFLIYHHKETIIQHPPIPPLQRRIVQAGTSSQYDPSVSEMAQAQLDAISFTLRRSGKVVRRIDSSPPIAARNWKGLERSTCFDNEQTIEQALAGRQLVAETIYILKPVVHLGSLACFGENAWKSYILSLLMDLSSIHLYRSCNKTKNNSLTKKQTLQLSRRTLLLLMYILRSPFYDKYSKDRIRAFLMALSKNVPLVGIICNPLLQYLPFWQSTYFYMWST